MDKNTFIAMLLMGLVVFGFMWLQQPSEAEMAEYQRQMDSIEAAQKAQQQSLFATLSPSQQSLVDLLAKNNEMTLDEIDLQCEMSLPKIASIMIELELKNIVRCLPGKIYKLS